MAQTLVASQAETPTLHLWTRTTYHRLADVGILPEGTGFELIEGRIYRKHTGGRLRFWTVEEYEQMPSDLFPEGARTELIEGQIYVRMGQNEPHIFALNYAARALRAAFGPDFDLLTQTPLKLGDRSDPEPDIYVFRGSLEHYEGRSRDLAPNVVLLVEVSDSSLSFDRKTKVRLYAKHRIPEYWIVNVRDRTLEIRRGPHGGDYAETIILSEGESATVGSGTIHVADVLPKK